MSTTHLTRSLTASVLLLSAGCTIEFVNKPPVNGQVQREYRFPAANGPADKRDETFVCLAFSGGGARAAALAHGVLRGLRGIELPQSDRATSRSLLDEVDLISGTSGGSFTALAYGVWGKAALEDGSEYERRFLKHPVELDLALLFGVRMLLSPIRTDFLARYLSEQVFNNVTYGDLQYADGVPVRPFIVVNATNLATGMRFRFTQDYFDLIGSDLSLLRVGYAAAASSAYPILLSDLRLQYQDNDLSNTAFTQVLEDYADASEKWELYRWARTDSEGYEADPERARFDHKDHGVLHLVDGGLADYTGLAFILEALLDNKKGIVATRLDGRIRNLVILLVDGGNDLSKKYESLLRMPEFDEIVEGRAASPVLNNAALLGPVVQRVLAEIERKGCRTYFADISLRNAPPTDDRERIIQGVDRLSLPTADIDWLIKEGERQVEAHERIRTLVADVGAASSRPAPP